MKSLLILGAGGHGRSVADIAHVLEHWDKIAFLDDRYPELKSTVAWPVIGPVHRAAEFLPQFSDFFVAIGDNRTRVELLQRYLKLGFNAPNLIHPQAFVSDFSSLGPGCSVSPQGVVNINSRLGMGCIVNTGASVGHDCTLGNGVQLASKVTLAGGVTIDDLCLLGVGASVIPEIFIGENVTIGAGATVIKNIASNRTVVGVPGKTREASIKTLRVHQTEPL